MAVVGAALATVQVLTVAAAADQLPPIVIATITADPPDNIPLCRSSPLRGYRSGQPCAPGGFT